MIRWRTCAQLATIFLFVLVGFPNASTGRNSPEAKIESPAASDRFVTAKVGEGHELLKNLKLLSSPIDLLHLVVTNMPLDVHQKQEILNLRPIDERITMMITFLNQELSSSNRPSRLE